MFVNYLTLMLLNIAIGFFFLGIYAYRQHQRSDFQKWVPLFGMIGIIAFILGLHMIMTWPIPGSYNIPYGELSILFGALFLGAAYALKNSLDLSLLTVYSFFVGALGILVGVRIAHLGLTKEPIISGVLFAASGLAAMLAFPIHRVKNKAFVHHIGATVMIIVSFGWLFYAYSAYWSHMEQYQNWKPSTMIERMQIQPQE